MFEIIQKTVQYKLKASPQSYKTELQLLANPGLA